MKTTFEGLTITGEFKGLKEAGWGSDHKNYNHHIITIQNNETNEQASFDYWCSIAQPRFEKESDLLGAFACWLDESTSGSENFEDFCGNLGYSDDSRKARKIWRECQRSQKQVLRVVGDEDKQQALLELLEQMGHR